MKKKVTTIVLNAFTNDSRVLKENKSLLSAGFEMKVLALHKEGLKEYEIIEDIPVYRLHPKHNKNKKPLIKESDTITPKINNIHTNPNIKKPFLGKIFNVTVKLINLLKRIINKIKQIVKRVFNKIKTTKKKIFNKIKTTKKKVLNKYFRIHRLKFNMAYVQQAKTSDIIHCNDLLTLPIGVIVKKFYNKDVKIVYDAHEYETELNGLVGKRKFFRKIMEKSLIKYADKVITVSDSIANEYVRLYNIDKPLLVLNTPIFTEITKRNIFRETFNLRQDQTIFLYQGALVKGRGIENILQSFQNIEGDKSVVVFMGYGKLEEIIQNSAKTSSNIYFHQAVSPDILLDYTSSADFGISMIEDICLSYRYCLPNKMFEYIMAEVPVIVSNLPEMKKIIESYNVGVVAQDNTPNGLEEAIKQAQKLNKEELNINIKNAKKIFNWEEQEKVLLKLYNELLD